MKALLAVTVIFLAISGDIYARFMLVLYPDELTDKSTLVCDGQVVDISDPGPPKRELKDGVYMVNEVEYVARINVLTILKGKAPATIDLHYSQVDPGTAMVNEPTTIRLEKGGKYRFYLIKDDKQPYYWGCLNGDYDDYQSVGSIIEPNGAADIRARFGELERDSLKAEHMFYAIRDIDPDFKKKRDAGVTGLLNVIVKCAALKGTAIDEKQRAAFEDDVIDHVRTSKPLFNSDGLAALDNLISTNIPDENIRAHVREIVDAKGL